MDYKTIYKHVGKSVLVPPLKGELPHLLDAVVGGQEVKIESPAHPAAQVQGAQLAQLGVAQGEVPDIKVLADAMLQCQKEKVF